MGCFARGILNIFYSCMLHIKLVCNCRYYTQCERLPEIGLCTVVAEEIRNNHLGVHKLSSGHL